MSEFTFIELHLHEGAISGTANAPFSGLGESDEAETGDQHEQGGGPGLLGIVVALALAGLVAWKLFGRFRASEE